MNNLFNIVKSIETNLSLYSDEYEDFLNPFDFQLKMGANLMKINPLNLTSVDFKHHKIYIGEDSGIDVEMELFYDFIQEAFVEEVVYKGIGALSFFKDEKSFRRTTIYQWASKEGYELDLDETYKIIMFKKDDYDALKSLVLGLKELDKNWEPTYK